jgi:hypothetical protein
VHAPQSTVYTGVDCVAAQVRSLSPLLLLMKPDRPIKPGISPRINPAGLFTRTWGDPVRVGDVLIILAVIVSQQRPGALAKETL